MLCVTARLLQLHLGTVLWRALKLNIRGSPCVTAHLQQLQGGTVLCVNACLLQFKHGTVLWMCTEVEY